MGLWMWPVSLGSVVVRPGLNFSNPFWPLAGGMRRALAKIVVIRFASTIGTNTPWDDPPPANVGWPGLARRASK
jgi:hypothetical protein